jgi:hypothetical protein
MEREEGFERRGEELEQGRGGERLWRPLGKESGEGAMAVLKGNGEGEDENDGLDMVDELSRGSEGFSAGKIGGGRGIEEEGERGEGDGG